MKWVTAVGKLQICVISWIGGSLQTENMSSKAVQDAKKPQNQNQKTYADYYQFWVPGKKKKV